MPEARPTVQSRKISFTERVYLAAERPRAGFSIEIVLEGSGDLSVERVQTAVERAAAVNPGCRLVLRGVLGWSRWVACGPLPPVRVLESWPDGSARVGIARPLSPLHGPTCELVLVRSPEPRILFRCFHGVMDAQGLLGFAEDVFRVLRGEPPVGADCTVNDGELVRSLVGRRTRAALAARYAPIRGPAGSRRRRVVSRRISLAGRIPAMVARVAAALARLAYRQHAMPTRIMIPVDLRRYQKGLRASGNLTYPIFLDVAAEPTWQEVHGTMLRSLAAKEALRLDPADCIVRWLPMLVLRLVYALWSGGHRRRGRFPFSAVVSHVHIPNAGSLSGGGFACRSVHALPQRTDDLPLHVAIVSLADSVEVTISAPGALLDEDRLAEVADRVEHELAHGSTERAAR